jgi:hypothetical protein
MKINPGSMNDMKELSFKGEYWMLYNNYSTKNIFERQMVLICVCVILITHDRLEF